MNKVGLLTKLTYRNFHLEVFNVRVLSGVDRIFRCLQWDDAFQFKSPTLRQNFPIFY